MRGGSLSFFQTVKKGRCPFLTSSKGASRVGGSPFYALIAAFLRQLHFFRGSSTTAAALVSRTALHSIT